ncbi:hypothetical protein M9458_008786, partial [Cirrhinus mrigala]
AIKYILPQRESTKPSGARPPSARRRGRPPAAAKTPALPPATTSSEVSPLPRCRAGRKGAAPTPGSLRSGPDSDDPEMEEIALPGTSTSAPPLPGKGREGVTSLLPPTSGSLGLWPRAVTLSDVLPPQVLSQSLSSREPGVKVGAACRSVTLLQNVSSSGLPHRGYVSDCSLDPTCSESGGVVIAPQPVSLVDPDSPAQLYNPIQTAPAQIQRCLCSATQLSRRGFTALISSYPRSPAGYDLSWIFGMLAAKRIFSCIHQQNWFAAIDLKDAYFHVSILPRHRPFLRFAFEGQAYQYRVLPFGLALSPRVFTKVAEGALSPLWEMGIRILNYLDDWLIIAHSRDLLCKHRDLVLQHLSHLRFQVNQEKSRLSPVQSISFLGMELDSVNMSARLTNERTHLFRHKTARLLGHKAAAAAVTPLGLLHMRPLQHWLHGRIPRWAWHRGTFRVGVTPECRRLFSPWSDPVFLRASAHGCEHRCLQDGLGRRLKRADSFGLLVGTSSAVAHQLPRVAFSASSHVLIRTDNVPTVAYIKRQGGLRSRRMSQLACHLLLSLRAVHIPGELNRAADALSRQLIRPGEWRLHPHVVQLIWSHFGEAQVDLFASPESSHCQLFYALDALAHSWPRGLTKYAFPPVSLLAQTLCKIREDEEQVLLVAPYWPTQTCPSLKDSPEEGPSFSGDGHNLAPASRPLEPPCVASGRDSADLTGLPQAVINTITQARAPSTRQAYALCSVGVVLSFLQDNLERRLSPSTLKVYVAAIAAYHDAKHHLIVRLNPPRSHLIPSWDLSVVLLGLRRAPFEPLASTSLLIALTSIKRLGDLHAFSVSESCLEFGPADSHVTLRPRPGYVPKVPTTPFRDQVVNLQALPPEEADPALTLLCPVRALCTYVDRTRSFRRSEQLFVCFGGQQMGHAVSKQRLAHWVVDAITLAYQCQGEPCPLGVRAHSTRSVASSWALADGTSLADICRAAGWATPNTFARFYNLRVEPVSSRVLGNIR